jgi:hypothetical protein
MYRSTCSAFINSVGRMHEQSQDLKWITNFGIYQVVLPLVVVDTRPLSSKELSTEKSSLTVLNYARICSLHLTESTYNVILKRKGKCIPPLKRL